MRITKNDDWSSTDAAKFFAWIIVLALITIWLFTPTDTAPDDNSPIDYCCHAPVEEKVNKPSAPVGENIPAQRPPEL